MKMKNKIVCGHGLNAQNGDLNQKYYQRNSLKFNIILFNT